MSPATSNYATNTRSIDKIKPVPKRCDCKLSDATQNAENAQELSENEPALLIHITCPLRRRITRRILGQSTK